MRGQLVTARPIDRRALIALFIAELTKAQQERSEREDITDSGEPEWAVFEREKLLELVNAERASRGIPPATMEAGIRVENSAVGYFDYTRTLAIGAADLVLAEGGG